MARVLTLYIAKFSRTYKLEKFLVRPLQPSVWWQHTPASTCDILLLCPEDNNVHKPGLCWRQLVKSARKVKKVDFAPPWRRGVDFTTRDITSSMDWDEVFYGRGNWILTDFSHRSNKKKRVEDCTWEHFVRLGSKH